MRWFSSLIAPLVFFVANLMFHSSLKQKSIKKHTFVMKLFRFCADNGHKPALSVYGHLLHFRGEGVQNRIQGGIYLERAAEKGDEKAQYQMGRIYEEGFEHYFSVNYAKSLVFYRKAAEQGHQLAVKKLVDVYSKGELGQNPDEKQSVFWSSKLPMF